MRTVLTVGFLTLSATTLLAATNIQETMTVKRCQAVLKDGKQCPNQTAGGTIYCWKHKGAVKVVRETADDVGTGAGKAWTSTKTWTTNAWENTRSGANKAWTSTVDAFDEAGREMGKGLRKVFDKDPSCTHEKK